MKYTKYIILVFVVAFPLAGFAFGKPLKIVAPEAFGLNCPEQWLCIDDMSRLEEAKSLYAAGITIVESRLSPLTKKPKVVFCSTKACFSGFGFGPQAGQSIGGLGVVIAPRGWKSYYVTHELIHQWQSEKYGALNVWLAPDWIVEGMAYALSDDPRKTLSEPFQTYRNHYRRQYGDLSGLALENALRSSGNL